MNRWCLYEMLKGNLKINKFSKVLITRNIGNMEAKELREGVIEYLLSQSYCAKP